MNKHAFDYEVYKVLLESNLSPEQKQRLVEVGIFKKMWDWLGAGKDTITKDMRKFMSDRKYQRYSVSAMKNIEKELESIMDAAEESTGSRDVVYDILRAILEKKGMEPGKVASGSGSSPAESGEGGGKGTGGGGEVKPGMVISPSASNPEQIVRIIVQTAAEVKGQSEEKAAQTAEKAVEKDLDIEVVTTMLASAIAEKTSAEKEKVEKIINYLLTNKHLRATKGSALKNEGRSRLTSLHLIEAARELNESLKNDLVLERWHVLAGVDKKKPEQINEEKLAAKLARKIANGEIKDTNALRKAATGFFGKIKLSATEIADLIDVFSKAREEEKPNAEDLEKKIADAVPKAKENAPDDDKSGDSGPKVDPEQVETTKKEEVFKTLRSKFKEDEIDDNTIVAVFDSLRKSGLEIK